MSALARCVAAYALLLLVTPTLAEPAVPGCPKPGVLGTSRTIAINPAAGPVHVGLKTYPRTLDLADHEVVLTFDDGPSPATTPRVLDALRDQCVRATFFLIGRNAAAAPWLVRREIAEGQTVGHHSMTHPAFTLRGFDTGSAVTDIESGIAADERAGYGTAVRPAEHPHVPFFRFPGFADTPPLLAALDARQVVVFGTDLWAADWLKMTPDAERARVIGLLQRAPHHNGIILFHDTQASTAAMLPAFLAELKAKGYRVVAVEPSEAGPSPAMTQPETGWRSATEAIIAGRARPIVPGAHRLAASGEGAPQLVGRSVATVPGTLAWTRDRRFSPAWAEGRSGKRMGQVPHRPPSSRQVEPRAHARDWCEAAQITGGPTVLPAGPLCRTQWRVGGL